MGSARLKHTISASRALQAGGPACLWFHLRRISLWIGLRQSGSRGPHLSIQAEDVLVLRLPIDGAGLGVQVLPQPRY